MKKSAWIIPPLALLLAIASLYMPPPLARYPVHDLAIPLLGFAGALSLFLTLLRRDQHKMTEPGERLSKQTPQWSILLLFIVGFGFFFLLSMLRYLTWHSAILDLGVYDQKVWLISQQPTWVQAWSTSVSGHFQPILLLYALLYRLWPSPVMLLFFQSLAIASGIVPLYLLATQRLRSQRAAFLVAGLYLLYPAVEFNALFDFHPDHLAIPLLLWAYYLADRHYAVGALCLAGVTALLKEPFFLTASFFAVYMALRHKRYSLGLGSCMLGLAIFYGIVFVNSHLTGNERSAILTSPSYRYPGNSPIEALTTPFRNPLAVLKEVTQRHKLSYLYSHFGPVAFIPLLAPLQLLPALPSFFVSLFSTTRLHSDPTSHYSAGAIASIFTALIYGIAWIQRKAPSRPLVVPLTCGILLLVAAFNVAKSPSPLSLYFWGTDRNQNWNRATYRFEKREVLNKAESLIPSDPNISVVSQNNLNSARLAHRYTYHVFPDKINEADYVILDTGRPHYIFDHFDEPRYAQELQELRDDPEVQLVFSEDGILVFKRSTGRHSMLLEGQ